MNSGPSTGPTVPLRATCGDDPDDHRPAEPQAPEPGPSDPARADVPSGRDEAVTIFVGFFLVSVVGFAFGLSRGYDLGVKETEARWSEAVGRADAQRQQESECEGRIANALA